MTGEAGTEKQTAAFASPSKFTSAEILSVEPVFLRQPCGVQIAVLLFEVGVKPLNSGRFGNLKSYTVDHG